MADENVYGEFDPDEWKDVRAPGPDYPHCPHFDLGPPDDHGVQICASCGSAVQLRFGGMTPDELAVRSTTVIAEEGADVAFDWPGEG